MTPEPARRRCHSWPNRPPATTTWQCRGRAQRECFAGDQLGDTRHAILGPAQVTGVLSDNSFTAADLAIDSAGSLPKRQREVHGHGSNVGSTSQKFARAAALDHKVNNAGRGAALGGRRYLCVHHDDTTSGPDYKLPRRQVYAPAPVILSMSSLWAGGKRFSQSVKRISDTMTGV